MLYIDFITRMKFLVSKRDVFTVDIYNPAPGEYEVTGNLLKKQSINRKQQQQQLKSEPSPTKSKKDRKPGPG